MLSLFLRAVLVALCLLCGCLPGWADASAVASLDTSALRKEVRLPLNLAQQMAAVSLEVCEKRGEAVSVSVVDRQGILQAFLHGDDAAPHTAELSRHKAYTAASLAALQGWSSTGELAAAMRKADAPVGALSLPSASVEAITPVAGGVVLRWHQQLLGGLGISGARQGQIDEDCARAGVAWLTRQLDGESSTTAG